MFSKKRIKVVIELVDEKVKFFLPNTNSLTFENLPVEVDINVVPLPNKASAKIKIYGVSEEYMNRITTIKWKEGFISQKAVYVYADDGAGYKLLFEGCIMDAFPRYESAPDVYIDISAVMGAYHNIREVPPFSRKGEVPTSQVFRDICADYGVDCLNIDVNTSCKNPYFNQHGLSNRLIAASRAYNVVVKNYNNRIEIYSQNGFGKKWNFTKNNYIGYPSLNNVGIKVIFDTIYDIGLYDIFSIDGSRVKAANDTWKIIKYKYSLSTKIGGKWLMSVDGTRVII